MSEYAGRPNLSGYVSIKEAAKLLGLSDKRVYEYVDEGRLQGVWAADVIMIPLEEVRKFQRRSSGRPRKNVPPWRISSGDNKQFMTSITVRVRTGQQDALLKKLATIKQKGLHTFPGTVVRLVAESQTVPGQVEIILVWRGMMMPDEEQREQALIDLRRMLEDVLDWDTAQYNDSNVLMHT
jgi:excisionase family DNA binding protein